MADEETGAESGEPTVASGSGAAPALVLSPGDPGTPGPIAPTVTTAVPPQCPTRTRMYDHGKVEAEGFSAEEISEHLDNRPDAVIWLDLYDPDESDLSIVTQEFGLHRLAVEDAVLDHQHAKLDRYRSHLFLNLYAAEVADSPDVRTAELSAFITSRALITVRKGPFDIDAVVQRWDLNAELAENGVGFLVYGFVDVILDSLESARLDLDGAVNELEDNLFDPRPGYDLRKRGFELRKQIAVLRRVTTPTQDVVSRLGRNDLRLFSDRMAPYFQDVHNNALQVTGNLEGTRERVADILTTNMEEQTNQLNEITKKLAGWAAIIGVPTAVTGFYGQNIPYPGFGHVSGFIASSALIAILAGCLYVIFRRRHWL
jgi:magnesium transporter